MRYRPIGRSLLLCGCIASPLALSDVLAQEPPRKSEIRGIVILAETRKPVVGAAVSLEGTQVQVATDKKGKFKFPKVAAGEYLIRAEIEGYPAATSTIQLALGERVEVEFLVGAEVEGQVLPEIEVTAADNRISPVETFNRRATEGNGRYIKRAEIERRRPASLMDLLRSVPGVRVVCPRSQHVCALRLRRATCGPAYFMDGMPTDPSVLYLTMPSDVEGVEIYSGPSETPIELEGMRSGCGAIAIWTRVGERPDRKKP
jgi:Carboxypeptidase regulatory-like domain/TonB-dependent Receptor Plug Domain